MEFNSIDEANRCLDDEGSKEVICIAFEVSLHSKFCKGVITGWDMSNHLDELVNSIVSIRGIVSIERLFRKIWNRDTKTMTRVMTHVICITWEGNEVPQKMRLYDGLLGFKVRPFVDSVLQCYRCFKYGHLSKHCRSASVCVACGENFHGHCERVYCCVYCGGRHKPTSKVCEMYLYNVGIKRTMAWERLSFQEAAEFNRRRDMQAKWMLSRNSALGASSSTVVLDLGPNERGNINERSIDRLGCVSNNSQCFISEETHNLGRTDRYRSECSFAETISGRIGLIQSKGWPKLRDKTIEKVRKDQDYREETDDVSDIEDVINLCNSKIKSEAY